MDPGEELRRAILSALGGDEGQKLLASEGDEARAASVAVERLASELRLARRRLAEGSELSAQPSSAWLSSAHRLDLILDGITQGVLVVDKSDRVIVFNRSSELFFGLSRFEVIGREYSEVIAGPFGEKFDVLIKRTRSGRAPIEYEIEREIGEGVNFHLGLTGSLMNLPGAGGGGGDVVVVVRDLHAARELLRLRERDESRSHRMSEVRQRLRQVERQLLRSEKLAAIGQMAAGIAHEVNNPLGALSGFIQVMLMDAKESGSSAELLDEMQKEVERIKNIVTRLLDFARYSTGTAHGKQELLDVRPILDDTLGLVGPQSRLSRVKVERVYDEEMGLVLGDADQLKQVFMNLCLNAVQAMPEGGELTVVATYDQAGETDVPPPEPARRSDDPPAVDFAQLRSGRDGGVGDLLWKLGDPLVRIEVRDTGPGVTEQDRPYVFEPFYTTKAKGTGLGLSTSQGIVRAHGGKLELVSSKEGTAFAVRLPVAVERNKAT